MSQECTTDDCQNQTHTYLCGRCVSDLQAWIDKIPVLIETLSVTIAKLDNVRPAGGGGGGGGHKPGSAAPINLDALQLQENLRSVWPSAKEYGKDSRASGLAWLIQEWVTKAELLVSGPDEPPVNLAEVRAKLAEAKVEPMPTRTLVPWLRQNARITITSKDVRNWAFRKKFFAVETEPQPTYNPYDVLDAWYETRREQSRT